MSVAAPSRQRRPRRAPTTTRPASPRQAERARRAAPRKLSPVAAGAVALIALVLAGVVALQVAALQQNIDRGNLEKTRQQLLAQVEELQAKVVSASAEPAVEARAQQLGMIRAPIDQIRYLDRG